MIVCNFPFFLRDETSLMLSDILPINSKSYDKNRAPKFFGQPTVVRLHFNFYFHYLLDCFDTCSFLGVFPRYRPVYRYD